MIRNDNEWIYTMQEAAFTAGPLLSLIQDHVLLINYCHLISYFITVTVRSGTGTILNRMTPPIKP